MESDSLRHLHALRNFIKNLIEQAERSSTCDCSRPPSLLLVGPPGAGKTFLVKQLSKAVDMPLYGVHAHHLESEEHLTNLFDQARSIEYPSLLFLDDVNYIVRDQNVRQGCTETIQDIRKELFSQLGHRKLRIHDTKSRNNPVKNLLNASPNLSGRHTDGDETAPDNDGLIIIAATSSPWDLYNDHELLSRFRGVYLVGLPDLETRFNILKSALDKVQHNLTDKEIWLVAEKTEGFTPSDLMIAIKALNFKQFSFLIPYAQREFQEEYSENSSETEEDPTDTETDSDYHMEPHHPQVKVAELMSKAATPIMPYLLGAAGAAVAQQTASRTGALSRIPSNPKVPNRHEMPDSPPEPKSRIETMAHGWTDTHRPHDIDTALPVKGIPNTSSNNSSRSPGGSDGLSSIDCGIPSPDSALGLSKSSEDDIEAMSKDVARDLFSSFPVDTPCDNNLSDTYPMEDDRVGNNVGRTLDECSDLISKCISDAIHGSFSAFDNNPPSGSGNGIRSSKLAQLLASATGGVGEINFRYNEPPDPMRNDNQGVASDLESEEDEPSTTNRRVNFSGIPENSRGADTADNANFSSYSPMAAEHNDTNSNAILRSLLVKSSDDKSKETQSKTGDSQKNMNYGLGCHGNIQPATPNLYEEENSPLKDLLDDPDKKTHSAEVSDSLAPTPTSVSPTPSEVSHSSQAPSHASSGSGARVMSNDIETLGKPTNQLTLVQKIRAPSDSSTVTCNEAEEPLEAVSDENSENEDKDEETETEEDSDETEEESEGTHRGIVNLNDLGSFSIKIITLADVLKVISNTARSVSDEEIKKYTDFMMWFANVAKSACPHNNKDQKKKAAGPDEISLASTSSLTPSMAKKRKKPLKKVGTFLLKALMFILD